MKMVCNPSSLLPPISRVLSFSSIAINHQNQDNVSVLFNMISPATIPAKTPVIPILDQWVQQGNPIIADQLKNMIKIFRNHNRYSQALQLSEWMTDKSYLDQSSGNIAVHLDLISRVHGLKQAENFFNTIPESLKDFKVYGTLLNCYTFKKSLKKAESVMEKMKQLGFMTTHSYHSMLNLYTKTRKHDRLVKLLQEMENTGVCYHRTTYYLQLTAYASFDIKEMERLLGIMEANLDLTLDWHVYIIAAQAYLNFGQNENSVQMLKKSEERVYQNTNRIAYKILLTVYANLGEKNDVYRMWDLYKKTWRKVSNKGYHHMISALVKVNDIEGAEKIVTEWESVTTSFDFWVVNVLINGYCKNGDWKKAEDYVERLVGMGKQPPASTWDCLASALCKHTEMEKAVVTIRKALLSYDGNWKLNQVTLVACVNYLKEKGDMEAAKEFENLIDTKSSSHENSRLCVGDASG